MAEPKRPMDGPQGACFERVLPAAPGTDFKAGSDELRGIVFS